MGSLWRLFNSRQLVIIDGERKLLLVANRLQADSMSLVNKGYTYFQMCWVLSHTLSSLERADQSIERK